MNFSLVDNSLATAMVFYRSKFYQAHLVKLLAVGLVVVIIYQTFLIQRFRTVLLSRELQYNQSKKGRKSSFTINQ